MSRFVTSLFLAVLFASAVACQAADPGWPPDQTDFDLVPVPISTEIVVGSVGDGIHFSHSYKLGSGRLTDLCIEHDPPRPFELERVRRIIDETLPAIGEIPVPQHASAVAGSASNLRRLVGPLLDIEALERAVRILCEHPSRRIARRFELEQERVRIMPAGALVLHACAVRLGVPLWFCKGGIREGAVLGMVAARLDRKS